MRWAWPLALVAAGALLFWLGRRTPSPPRPPSEAEAPLPAVAAFAGSARCLSCHLEEHAAWQATGHARTLRPASEASAVFDGKPVGEVTPQREGGALLVKVESRDRRAPGNHRVTWVVGHRTELCLFTDARGAWRLLPIAWQAERKAWIPTAALHEPLLGEPAPGDVRQLIFNRECGHCHATRFDTGFRPEAQGEAYESRMAEAGVSCEACHGAGSVHALWHEEKRTGAYEAPARLHPGGSGGCLLCHGTHELLFAPPEDPAAPLADSAVSRDFDGPGFFADGRRSAAHGTGTAFAGSACARGGATCLSCHAVHGEARPTGDAACTGCHEGFAGRGHTFHDAVACVDCHMPRLALGRRDHSIRSPEPALTERFGIPNACAECHGDRTAEWAGEAKERWYGPPDERMLRDTALVADLRKGLVAWERLAETARDPRSPLFFRSTALRALPRGDETLRAALGWAEVDLVQAALATLARRPDPAAGAALVDLLRHPARTVRVEAAYALARAGWRPPDTPRGLRDDARSFVVRQYGATPLLVRAAWILDAIGGSDEMAYILPAITERAPLEGAPLIIRRGRALAQAGKHAEALIAYDDARRILGDATPAVLYVDSADSLAATGDLAGAEGVWRHAIARIDPSGVEHAIVAARLLGVEGRGEEGLSLLAPVAARLAEDPAGGDMLRRVRWSMDELAR